MDHLTFPLYHATSSIFEDSIKEFGLGGVNIVEQYHVLEFLRELEAIADAKLGDHDDWKYIPKTEVSYITNQKLLPGGNFQHGEVYLTPSLYTAKRYAKNKYGSEIMSVSFSLLNLLNKHNIQLENALSSSYTEILALRYKVSTPIIYKISNLPVLHLKNGEKEETLESQIKKVEEVIREFGNEKYERYVQQINFRVGKPIPWKIINS